MKKTQKILSLILVFIICISTSTLYVSAETQNKVGDVVTFGSYPQSEITNSTLKLILLSNALEWKSYEYYSGDGSVGSMKPSDNIMQYADVEYNGTKYRGVSIINYRPGFTIQECRDICTVQDANGYQTNKVYWFKFEPLTWRILDPIEGLLLCENVIDTQPYNNCYFQNEKINDERFASFSNLLFTNYASDWETSSIRTWLNNDFYNTAFTPEEKNIIKTTLLNNESWYTIIGDKTSAGDLDSNTTNDNIFLLSFDEAINADYGFDSNDDDSASRRSKYTKYALCQGLIATDLSGFAAGDFCDWTLRSPGYSSSTSCFVSCSGSVGVVSHTYHGEGIRPALKIDFKSLLSPDDSINYGITTPSTTTINYGDSIILHVNYEEDILSNAEIVWNADNTNFNMNISEDKKSCKITPKSSGDTVFSVVVLDNEGNIKSSDSQKMTAKAGVFYKILAFIKSILGLNKTLQQYTEG